MIKWLFSTHCNDRFDDVLTKRAEQSQRVINLSNSQLPGPYLGTCWSTPNWANISIQLIILPTQSLYFSIANRLENCHTDSANLIISSYRKVISSFHPPLVHRTQKLVDQGIIAQVLRLGILVRNLGRNLTEVWIDVFFENLGLKMF